MEEQSKRELNEDELEGAVGGWEIDRYSFV